MNLFILTVNCQIEFYSNVKCTVYQINEHRKYLVYILSYFGNIALLICTIVYNKIISQTQRYCEVFRSHDAFSWWQLMAYIHTTMTIVNVRSFVRLSRTRPARRGRRGTGIPAEHGWGKGGSIECTMYIELNCDVISYDVVHLICAVHQG